MESRQLLDGEDWQALCQLCDEGLGAPEIAADAKVRAVLHLRRSSASANLRWYDEAEEHAKQSQKCARQAEDDDTYVRALQAQADAQLFLGLPREAIRTARSVLYHAGPAVGHRAQSYAYQTFAEAYRVLGRYRQSLDAASDAVGHANLQKDKSTLAYARQTLAESFLAQDLYGEALRWARLALRAAKSSKSKSAIGLALAVLARVLARAGDRREARKTAAEFLSVAPGQEAEAETTAAGFYLSEALLRKRASERQFADRLCAPPVPICKERVPPGAQGALVVYRDWASYTAIPLARRTDTEPRPSPQFRALGHEPVSGGYLLSWRGKGLAIDPGIGFLRAMAEDGLVFANIDAVALTHYHIDHVDDLLQVLTCIHEREEAQPGKAPPLTFYVSPSCADVYRELISHVTDREPEVLNSTAAEGVPALDGALLLWASPANHQDLHTKQGGGKRSQCIGLRLELIDEHGHTTGTVGVTGDTGWSQEVSDAFTLDPRDLRSGSADPKLAPVDLLVAHVGSVYEDDVSQGSYHKSHLGRNGVTKLLADIDAAHGPSFTHRWLAVISEWGEEMAAYRAEFTRSVRGYSKHGNVVPGVRDLYVALPQCTPVCQLCRRAPASSWLSTSDGTIEYICRHHLSTPGDYRLQNGT
jgi:tetratricopeptide (TPR) repeat protein